MSHHEIEFGFDLQKYIRAAERRNARLSDAEASFACEYPCGCFRVFAVNKETVEVTLKRHPQCDGTCLPALQK